MDKTESYSERIITTLANVEFIGTPPELSMKLFQRIKDENVSIKEISSLILQNPPLCVSLLKAANSAYYNARGVPIETVSRAIIKLGLKMIAHYVFAFEVLGTFQAKNFRTDFDITIFWKNSFAHALLSLNISGKFKAADPESAFLSGLLSNVGILVIRQYFPDIFMKICAIAKNEKVSFNTACTLVCCLDHRYVAYLLALKWNLPLNILSMFHTPSDGTALDENAVITRSIVQYSAFVLFENQLYTWDAYQEAPGEKREFSKFPTFTADSIAEISKSVDELITFQV